jgi:hypothetical protein
VTVTCPAGKQVLGAGAELLGGEAQVTLNDVIPDATLTSVTAKAFEDQTGFSGSWGLRARAICATPPPGLERVVRASPSDSLDKTVSATCPGETRLLGAGGAVDGATREVMVQDVRLDSLTRVTSEGVEDDDGAAVDWQVRAYAICSDRVHLLQRVEAASPSNSLKAKTATVDCTGGRRVVGVGGAVEGIGGDVALNDLAPTDPMTGATAHAAEDEDGTPSSWVVRSFAICAAASERVVETSTTEPSYFHAATSLCPSDWRATGGGASVSSGAGQVRVDGAFPVDDVAPGTGESTGFFGDAFVDRNGYAADWFMRSFGICATPLPGLVTPDPVFSSGGSPANAAVTATCPAGTRVVGAGGGIPSDGSPPLQVVMYRLTPDAGLTSVTVAGHEDEVGDDLGWVVFASPICGVAPPGLELVVANSPSDSSDKSVTATCPAGKNLLGAGARISGGVGEVVIDDVAPNHALTGVLVTGLEDETGYSGTWAAHAYAICASP